MKAQILRSFDGAALGLEEVGRPLVGSGQVLIKVAASGVNPIDTKIRRGLSPYAQPLLPAILGTDVAGTIEEVGTGVNRFDVGDEVFGLVGGVRGSPGSLAEYVAVDARLLAIKPRTLSMREAAALPLVSLTAWEGLVDRAKIKTGHKVLVHGGSGGVGHVAIQIAKAFGAEVYATASSAKLAVVADLGATPIDRAEEVKSYVERFTAGQGFDVIYDTVGGEALDASLAAIRYYGHVVSCAAFGPTNLAPGSLRCASVSGIFVLLPMLNDINRHHHGDILSRIADLADRGLVKPRVDPRHFTLDDAMAAHAAQEDGSAASKIVVDVAE